MSKKIGKVSVELDEALAAEIREIRRTHTEDVYDGAGENRKQVAKKGDYVYPTLERMRVYDRALKLEMVKVKIESPEWGSAFGKTGKGGTE